MDKESHMNGKLGLGMAIPEDANAKLGPLPTIMHNNNRGREFEVWRLSLSKNNWNDLNDNALSRSAVGSGVSCNSKTIISCILSAPH